MATSSTSSKPDGNTHNGFRTTAETDAVLVDRSNIAPFSLPQEALTFKPDEATIIHPFKSGDRERKIHCNIELLAAEQASLRALQEEVERQGIIFAPAVTVMATRYLSQARGDVTRAIEMMQKTHAWRLEYFATPIVDNVIAEDMKFGICYWIGRDKCLRPTLVVRAGRIPKEWHVKKCYDRMTRLVIFCMEYFLRYMVLPGQVEGINLLCDMDNIGISQVPVSVLTDLHKSMGCNYTGRVFRFYICNMSWVLKGLVGIAKGILSDRQNQKLLFVSNNTELRQDFALHQLEDDLGGSRPPVKTFFPFPLVGGPFDGGNTAGEAPGKVPWVQEALTAEGHRGRLWNPNRSKEDNARLQFTDKAPELMEKVGIKIAGSTAGTAAEGNENEEADYKQKGSEKQLETIIESNPGSPTSVGSPAKATQTDKAFPEPRNASNVEHKDPYGSIAPIPGIEYEDVAGSRAILAEDTDKELQSTAVSPASLFGCGGCRKCTMHL